ncbi:MAG: double zinc ribbon domain-containing protein [Thermoplasmatota archaeon]
MVDGRITCPICGSEVSKDAEECPGCSQPFDSIEVINELADISGVGNNRAKSLYEHGYNSAQDIVDYGMEELVTLPNIGLATAKKIVENAEDILDEEDDELELEDIEEEDMIEELKNVFDGLDMEDIEGDIEGERSTERDELEDEEDLESISEINDLLGYLEGEEEAEELEEELKIEESPEDREEEIKEEFKEKFTELEDRYSEIKEVKLDISRIDDRIEEMMSLKDEGELSESLDMIPPLLRDIGSIAEISTLLEIGKSKAAELKEIGGDHRRYVDELKDAKRFYSEGNYDRAIDDLEKTIEELDKEIEVSYEEVEVGEEEEEEVEELGAEEEEVEELEVEEETKTCPSCGADISIDSQGCPICGTIFEYPSKKEPVSSMILPFSTLIVPLFLMIYVSLEFFTALIANPFVYPFRALLYFTPLPLFLSSWTSSIAFSFLAVVGLFALSVKGIQYISDERKFIVKDRMMLTFAVILSAVITISLGLYLVTTPFNTADIFSLVLLMLVLSTTGTQSFILASDKYQIFREESTEDYIICPNCQTELPPEARRCHFCGEELGISEIIEEEETDGKPKVTIECPLCGAELPADVKVCSECGEPLDEEAEDELIAELEKIEDL